MTNESLSHLKDIKYNMLLLKKNNLLMASTILAFLVALGSISIAIDQTNPDFGNSLSAFEIKKKAP